MKDVERGDGWLNNWIDNELRENRYKSVGEGKYRDKWWRCESEEEEEKEGEDEE